MNNYFVKTASDEIKEQYKSENDAGHGMPIGDDEMTIEDAIEAAGWHLDESFADSLATAHDDRGNDFIIGGDGSRRNAWAVSA